ncbi:MAG: S-layer homology domain-containing protein [Lawsonibacter sp.]
MLWRYAGSPAGGGSLSSFGDSASVSAYALEAVRWAAGEGLISGTDAGLLALRAAQPGRRWPPSSCALWRA